MTPKFTMRRALDDPQLLGSSLAGPSWSAWRTMLVAAAGERLTRPERKVFRQFTGRDREPGARVEEAAFIIGRRGGKDRAASVLAAYITGCCSHPELVAGERGVVLCIAPDQKQSAVTLGYVQAAFEQSPILSQLMANRTSDALELASGITVEVRAASFRRLRGVTCVAVIATEAAFWFDAETGSTNADVEILNAVRPTLATTGGPLIIITSPYARRGETWSIYRKHFGVDGDPLVLVAQGASRDFNPTLPQRVVDRAMERDPASASAEYLAQFRTDIESFISREAVEAVVARGVRERAPLPDQRYYGFIDPSGGSSDSMTLAIGHREGETAVLDLIREVRPPFSPESVTTSFAADLKRYRCRDPQMDRYGAEWVRSAFRKHGISARPAAKPKSGLYVELLAPINSGKVDLLDNDRLVAQLCSLERRTARSGKDSIDHPPTAHDDVSNCVAGVTHVVLHEATCDLDQYAGLVGPFPAAEIIRADGGAYSSVAWEAA